MVVVGGQQEKEEKGKFGEVGMHLWGDEEAELFQKLGKELGKQTKKKEHRSQWCTYTLVEESGFVGGALHLGDGGNTSEETKIPQSPKIPAPLQERRQWARRKTGAAAPLYMLQSTQS